MMAQEQAGITEEERTHKLEVARQIHEAHMYSTKVFIETIQSIMDNSEVEFHRKEAPTEGITIAYYSALASHQRLKALIQKMRHDYEVEYQKTKEKIYASGTIQI